MIEYAIVHVACFFIIVGFILRKDESPYIKSDASFYLYHFSIAIVIAPIWVLILIGLNLHGDIE